MTQLQQSMMDVIITYQQHRKLLQQAQQAGQLKKRSQEQERQYQKLLNEYTKVVEESDRLKLQIKDICKATFKLNRQGRNKQNMRLKQVKDKNEMIENLNKSIEQVKDQNSKLNKILNTKQGQFLSAIKNSTVEVEELRLKVEELKSKVRATEIQKSELSVRLKDRMQQMNDAMRQMRNTQDEYNEQHRKCVKLEQQIAKLKQQRDKLNNQLKKCLDQNKQIKLTVNQLIISQNVSISEFKDELNLSDNSQFISGIKGLLYSTIKKTKCNADLASHIKQLELQLDQTRLKLKILSEDKNSQIERLEIQLKSLKQLMRQSKSTNSDSIYNSNQSEISLAGFYNSIDKSNSQNLNDLSQSTSRIKQLQAKNKQWQQKYKYKKLDYANEKSKRQKAEEALKRTKDELKKKEEEFNMIKVLLSSNTQS